MPKIIRKFYGSSDPNVHGDLYLVTYEKTRVTVRGPSNTIYLNPTAAKRLGECLVDNAGLPGLLNDIEVDRPC